MDEQKRNRIAAALTVNVILLIVILAAVLIYQLSAIVSANARRAEIESEIKRYEQLIEEGKNDLEVLRSEQFLLDYAIYLGYYFPKG